jgi:hypothetical protein
MSVTFVLSSGFLKMALAVCHIGVMPVPPAIRAMCSLELKCQVSKRLVRFLYREQQRSVLTACLVSTGILEWAP